VGHWYTNVSVKGIVYESSAPTLSARLSTTALASCHAYDDIKQRLRKE